MDYALGRFYWNQGITTEALKGVLEWAFPTISSLEYIHSGCLSKNIGSSRVLEKAGFKIKERYSSIRGGKFDNNCLETTTFELSKTFWQGIIRKPLL